jgi:hypothetical protein
MLNGRYSTDYLKAESATERRLGIWRGEFIPPWEWAPRAAEPRSRPLSRSLHGWPDQDPAGGHFDVNGPCAGGSPAYLEIDKLLGGHYFATVGTLFEHQEVCPTGDLETWVRQANAMAGVDRSTTWCSPFRAMRHT